MAKKPALHLCIDRIVPMHHKTKAAALAVAENSQNRPKMGPPMLGVSNNPLKIALQTGKRWSQNKVLGVRFMDGTKLQKAKVEQYAQEWSKYCNIGFNFKAGAKSEIRVSFQFDPGNSWSAIGTDCLVTDYFPKDEPTMNFGWFEDDTDEEEYRRVIEHEFGHAIGAIHEHQNPQGGIRWNLKAVYDYFSGPPNNWSKDEIDSNVIGKYSLDQLNGTKFDPKSIMLYSFPPELTLNHVGTDNNTRLSSADKQFVRKMYPKKS
jgi:hypothetical protein